MRPASDLGLWKASDKLAHQAGRVYTTGIRSFVGSPRTLVRAWIMLKACSSAGAAVARTVSYAFGSTNPTCKHLLISGTCSPLIPVS